MNAAPTTSPRAASPRLTGATPAAPTPAAPAPESGVNDGYVGGINTVLAAEFTQWRLALGGLTGSTRADTLGVPVDAACSRHARVGMPERWQRASHWCSPDPRFCWALAQHRRDHQPPVGWALIRYRLMEPTDPDGVIRPYLIRAHTDLSALYASATEHNQQLAQGSGRAWDGVPAWLRTVIGAMYDASDPDEAAEQVLFALSGTLRRPPRMLND